MENWIGIIIGWNLFGGWGIDFVEGFLLGFIGFNVCFIVVYVVLKFLFFVLIV